MRRLALLLALLIAPSVLHAQTVTSGTVKDPNNLAYSSASLTITGAASLAIPLNSAGGFTISLTPGVYTFSAFFGGIAPPIGTGPQTCTATNITVSGGTFSVPFTCPALTNFSGGSAGNPAAPPCALQLSNTAVSGFITANLGGNYLETDSCTSPTTLFDPFALSQAGTQYNAGPNPVVDTQFYNMRAVAADFQAVATASTASPHTVNFTSGSYGSFQTGDGMVIYGAGATNTLSTPGAPTVTPASLSGPDTSNDFASGPTGSTTYPYCIVARDKNGGLTACSTNGTTTTGVASLGLSTATVSTLARSGNTVTVTDATASNAAVGGIAFITGSTDATLSGMFKIASVTPPDVFTYTQGISTVYGGTASATGGTSTVYNCNHLSWTAVLDSHGNPAWQYYIYAGAGGVLLGVTKPGETYWNDCGAISYGVTLPDFVPATAPTNPTNDYLPTVIGAGGGSATATIAGTILNSVTGTEVKFDDAPTFSNAWLAAAGSVKSVLRVSVPTSGDKYYFNSNLDISNGPFIMSGGGCMVMNETMELPSIVWSGKDNGACIGNPQFEWNIAPTVTIGSAYPGFTAPLPVTIDHIYFVAPAQGLILTIGGGYEFNAVFENDTFALTGTDYFGQGLVEYAASNTIARYTSFLTNDTSAYGYSLTPTVLLKDNIAGSAPSGGFWGEHCYFVGRGWGIDNTPTAGGGGVYRFVDSYSQANRTPIIMVGAFGIGAFSLDNLVSDTSNQADFANWSGAGAVTLSLLNMDDVSSEASGRPGIVTGNPIRGLYLGYNPNAHIIGQNYDLLCPIPVNNAGDLVSTVCTQAPVAGLQLNQNTSGLFAGTATLVGGTKAITFTNPYQSTPICTANDQTAVNAVQVTPSTTGLTLTGTGTDVIAWNCTGNPN